ncbi:DUF4259 domain-containing protein [Rhodococcus sp. NPDC058521]|uniref:DUF4259 domain-containing protein n=1 Tax=Rhodococcus sp. NPDC058521 TaxID=3346536 RepID=UPI00364B9444
MGAWDLGPFDNDGAMNALGEIEKAGPQGISEALVAAMDAVVANETYIETDCAQAAVAAAALVALRAGAEADDPSASTFLDSNPFEATRELKDHASKTFERIAVKDDNGWFALWDEAGCVGAVVEGLGPYRVAVA